MGGKKWEMVSLGLAGRDGKTCFAHLVSVVGLLVIDNDVFNYTSTTSFNYCKGFSTTASLRERETYRVFMKK